MLKRGLTCFSSGGNARTQLLLTWSRNLIQFEVSLSSAGYLPLTHYFSVTSENVGNSRKLHSLGYIFVAESMGLTSTT